MHQKNNNIQISEFVIEDDNVTIFGGNMKTIFDHYDGIPPFLEKLMQNVEKNGNNIIYI